MLVKLRIIFTILSAVCAAAVVPVGTFFGLIGALICVVAAIMFFVIMLGFKSKQETKENPPQQQPDFFHPKKSDASATELPKENVREWNNDEENA